MHVRSSRSRHGRLIAAAASLALLASLAPLVGVSAAVGVTAATGGGAISADTAANGGTGAYTPLIGPVLQEGSAGDLNAGGSVTLTVPAGFQFNPNGVAIGISPGNCNIGLTPVLMTATSATVTINANSTHACTVTFNGLQVRPINGTPLASGNITNTGNRGPSGGNYGHLQVVRGAPVLTFTTQPSPSATGGVDFATQPTVHVEDRFGNDRPNDSVTLSITPGTGSPAGKLVCNQNPRATGGSGNVTFSGCAIDIAGINYRIRASTGGSQVDSNVIDVAVGPSHHLVFSSYPAATTPTLLTPQPAVSIVDAGGNLVNDSRTITLSINKHTGTFTCTGGLTRPASFGIASFAGCTQTDTDTNYTLKAVAAGLASVTGPAFKIGVGAPSKLIFTVQPPASTIVGQPFAGNVRVAIADAAGNVISNGITATIQLAIGNNPTGAALACNGGNTANTSNGVATFTGCTVSIAGAGYTLVAAAAATAPPTPLTPAQSNAFAISAGAASIFVTTLPSNGVITWGGTVLLNTHFATNGAGKTFALQVSKDKAAWSTIATLTTNGNGDASFPYRPSDNRYYRAVFLGTPDLAASTSAIVRVVVRQTSALRPTNGGHTVTVKQGTVVTFATTVRPNRPELPQAHVNYVVYQLIGSQWTLIRSETIAVNVAGIAVMNVTFSPKGEFYVRSQAIPTPLNANSGWSPVERYKVT